MRRKNAPLRLRYLRQLIVLLLSSFIIFFAILCLVEFRKAIVDPEKFPEAAHEVAVFFGVGLASMPFAIFIAWRLTRRLLDPISRMARTADEISAGAFNQRIELNDTYDELDQLAASFNLAFNRYEKSLARLREFSGVAAHQLRTPLAAIRTTGETALLAKRSTEDYEQTIGQMLEELRRLTGTVDQLLQLARLEAGTLRKSFAAFELRSAVANTVDRFKPLIELKNIHLETRMPHPVDGFGNPELIEQVVANLLDNAIRHAPENGMIRVSLSPERLCVEDDGPGVPPPLLEHLFQPFQRCEETGNNGLGLAIAERVVKLHGGTIHAENRVQGGARFVVEFETTADGLETLQPVS